MADLSQVSIQPDMDEADEDYWLVCLHEVAGCPAILRLIAEVPHHIEIEAYGDLVAIVWDYDPEPDGLPNEAESARMDFFEDLLVEAVEGRMNACLAIVSTATGSKEWTLYADSGDTVSSYVKAVVVENGLPVQVRCGRDPQWVQYRRLLTDTGDEPDRD